MGFQSPKPYHILAAVYDECATVFRSIRSCIPKIFYIIENCHGGNLNFGHFIAPLVIVYNLLTVTLQCHDSEYRTS